MIKTKKKSFTFPTLWLSRGSYFFFSKLPLVHSGL